MKKNIKQKNIIYLLNGSIGDFLMVLVLMKEIHNIDNTFSLYISTPRGKKTFQDLACEYPYVTLIDQKPLSFLRFIFRKNYIITPPTPGRNPLHIKVLSKVLSLRGKSVGFDDGYIYNKLFFSCLIPFNPKVLFVELLFKILPEIGLPSNIPNTRLSFEKKSVTEKSPYIILHPFGSSDGRSIFGKKLEEIILCITELFPDHRVLVSGSKDDVLKVEGVKFPSSVEIIAGKYSLVEMAEVLSRADMYIGVDTGITHLASVLGKKSLVIAEQGAPHWLPYYNDNAVIVYKVLGDESGVFEGREYRIKKNF